jgi:predicted ribonuclease YlaK
LKQAFAIHALLHPDIKLVTIQGNAGTGKTLLAWPAHWSNANIIVKFLLHAL